MARQLSSAIERLRPSVFSRMKVPADCLRLHIGDTHHLPPEAARLAQLPDDPAFYRYAHPFGQTALLEALVNKHKELGIDTDWLQITVGATQALSCAVQTLIEPGQRVALMAPYWPLFGGMARLQGAVVQEITHVSEVHPDCRLLYFANPNNPDGKVYSRAQLQELADVAIERDLWVLSDEVYEHYLYEPGAVHTSIASLPGMAERTLTCFSFSKSYAMAGHRLGYALASPKLMNGYRRVANHNVYNVSPLLQLAALRSLQHSAEFLASVLPGYRENRDILWEACQNWAARPEGGAYLWLQLKSEQAALALVDGALERGLAMAPGAAFGEDFAHCVRVCFTAVDRAGIERAAQILMKMQMADPTGPAIANRPGKD